MMCKICNTEHSLNNIREGVCWECAEAESIIFDGTDMNDLGFNGKLDQPAVTAIQKLSLMIEKGWVHLSSMQKKQVKR